MSPSRRERILALYDHRCAFPLCEETTALELDHIVPLELGGADDDSNIEPLCQWHHKAKTRDDIRRIRKAQRLRRREAGEERVKRKIRSRGFSKDPLR